MYLRSRGNSLYKEARSIPTSRTPIQRTNNFYRAFGQGSQVGLTGLALVGALTMFFRGVGFYGARDEIGF